MSTTRYERDGLSVNTYAGPEGCNPNTGGRACVQITSHGRYVGLSMDHWVDLVSFIRSLDARGLSVLTTPEV